MLDAKQVLPLSPYVLWLDADAAFMRYDIPVRARRDWLLCRIEFQKI